MEFRFNAEEWDRMTPAQRIQFCRTQAEHAQRFADQADDKFRPLYAELAAQWLRLASEIANAEREMLVI